VRAVLVRLADIQVAPLVEQVRAEAAALDRLEELLGNDLVGVDVGAIQRADQARVLGKGFHHLSPQAWISSRTSMKWPVTAAAAAMAGLTRWVRPPAP